MLFHGGVILCPTAGECVTLTERCGVAQLVSKKEADVVKREVDRAELAGTAFPYVASQSRLLREFRIARASQCATPVRALERQQQRLLAVTDPPLPSIPPEEAPPEVKGNNGFGNGGEGSEGPTELGNPGHSKHKH